MNMSKMGKTILDILPKIFGKKKAITLYIAYYPGITAADASPDLELTVDMNFQPVSTSREAAVQHVIDSLSLEDCVKLNADILTEDCLVFFEAFTFKKDDLVDIALIDGDAILCGDTFPIKLDGKKFSVDTEVYHIATMYIEHDPNTDGKIIKNLNLAKESK